MKGVLRYGTLAVLLIFYAPFLSAGNDPIEAAIEKWEGKIPKPESLELSDHEASPYHYYSFLHEYSLRFDLPDLQRVLESDLVLREGALFTKPRAANEEVEIRSPGEIRKLVLTHLIAKPWLDAIQPPLQKVNRFEVKAKPYSFSRLSDAVMESNGKGIDSLRLYLKAYEQMESLGFPVEARLKYAEELTQSGISDPQVIESQKKYLATHLARRPTEQEFHRLWKHSPGLVGLNTRILADFQSELDPGYLPGFLKGIKDEEARKKLEQMADQLRKEINDTLVIPFHAAGFGEQSKLAAIRIEKITKRIESLSPEEKRKVVEQLTHFRKATLDVDQATKPERVVAFALAQGLVNSLDRTSKEKQHLIDSVLSNEDPLGFSSRLLNYHLLVTADEGLGIKDRVADGIALHLASLGEEGVLFSQKYVEAFRAASSDQPGEMGKALRLIEADKAIGHGFEVGRGYAQLLSASDRLKALELASKQRLPGANEPGMKQAPREPERGVSLSELGQGALFTAAGFLGAGLLYQGVQAYRKSRAETCELVAEAVGGGQRSSVAPFAPSPKTFEKTDALSLPLYPPDGEFPEYPVPIADPDFSISSGGAEPSPKRLFEDPLDRVPDPEVYRLKK